MTISGYGTTGPYRDRVAFGTTVEPVSGLAEVLGYEAGGPRNSALAIPDAVAGVQATSAVVTALRRRRRTGRGCRVELSLHEAGVGLCGPFLIEHQLGGGPGRLGNRHPAMAPHGVYRTAGADDWVALACRDGARLARPVRPGRRRTGPVRGPRPTAAGDGRDRCRDRPLDPRAQQAECGTGPAGRGGTGRAGQHDAGHGGRRARPGAGLLRPPRRRNPHARGTPSGCPAPLRATGPRARASAQTTAPCCGSGWATTTRASTRSKRAAVLSDRPRT